MFSELLISTALVMRRTAVNDGMGGSKSDFTLTVAEDVPCRVCFPKAGIRDKARLENKDIVTGMCTIFTEYRTDLRAFDRFIVEGVNYDTQSVNDPSLMHHHLEFAAKKLT